MISGVGILGYGYLGNEVARVLGSTRNIWVTRQTPPSLPEIVYHRYQPIVFQWNVPASWSNLPERESVLVITIPPVHDHSVAERARLLDWCQWIVGNRPYYRHCIYISSTGVYPNLPGIWQEESSFQCDTQKGELRRVSESVLSDYFETIVIRPGAIYGDDRNIGKRILAGKPIPSGEQPVHRIHVHDLARIINQALADPDFPDLVNAVDLKRETSKQVASWLLQQPFFPRCRDSKIAYRTEFQTRKFNLSEPDRTISNHKLVAELGFTFVYPTYQEGLTHAFANNQTRENRAAE